MFDYDLNEVYEFEEWHDLNRDEIMAALMEALMEETENA